MKRGAASSLKRSLLMMVIFLPTVLMHSQRAGTPHMWVRSTGSPNKL